MTSPRWNLHWNSRFEGPDKDDLFSPVQRTKNGKSITRKEFQEVINHVSYHLSLTPQDKVLELFCGNGVMTYALASRSAEITAVDYSKSLLGRLDRNKPENVITFLNDVMELNLSKASFSKVVAYAGFQYLSEDQAAVLIARISKWLVPSGNLFIGDLPDIYRRSEFAMGGQGEHSYFDAVIKDGDPIGTWYDPYWIKGILERACFDKVEILEQPYGHLNSHYRFDVSARRSSRYE